MLRKFALQSKAVTRDVCAERLPEVEKALQTEIVEAFKRMRVSSKSRQKVEDTDKVKVTHYKNNEQDFDNPIEPGKLVIDSEEATIEIIIKRKRSNTV